MVNKKVLLYWFLCSVLMVVGIHYLDGAAKIDDWPGFLLGVFFGVLLLVLLSIVLAVILACFPFRSTRTPKKAEVRKFLPTATVSLTVIAFAAFLYSRPSYASASAAPALCQGVREGMFRLDDYLIERKGAIQTETDTITKETWVYRVKWLQACECELTDVRDTTDVTRVKIIKVTEDGYTCVARSPKRTTKHTVQIVKKEE